MVPPGENSAHEGSRDQGQPAEGQGAPQTLFWQSEGCVNGLQNCLKTINKAKGLY